MSGSGVARRCSPISSPVPGRWPVVGGRVSAGRCRGPVIAAGDAGTPRPAIAGARRRSDTGRRPAIPRRGAGRVPAASRTTPPLGSRPVPGRSPPAPQAPSSGRSRRSFPPGWQGSCSPSQTSVDRRAQRAGDAMMADDPATLVGDTRWCCNRDLPPEPRPAGWRRHAASTAQRGSLLSAASPAEPAAAEARGEPAHAALEQGETAAIMPNYWPCRSLSVSAPCMTSGTRRLATGLSGRGQQVRRACSISAAVAR